MTPLKLGLIGGGLSSAIGQTHFAASRLDGRWKVAAGAFSTCDLDCRQTAEQWGIPSDRTFSDWRKMIDRVGQELDAIAVLTPTPDHYPVIAELLEREVPVISEKALVASVEEADALKTLFDPARHFLAVTYNYSGYPMVRELRRIIQSGRLGTVQQIHVEMPQEGFLRPPVIDGEVQPPQQWRRKDGVVPTVCLDLGVHLHHLSTFLTGLEPEAVMADMAGYSQWGVIDHVQVLLRYPEQVRGSMWMTKTALGHRNGLRVRIYGDEGAAEWFQMQPEQLQLSWQDGRIEVLDRAGPVEEANARRYTRMKPGHPAGFVEAFANLYWDIADALETWKSDRTFAHPYVYGLDHARQGLRLFEAARTSFETGTWVSL